ncbi:MAG: putative toxin-antitoxin system toxin component, PIN family, partial [Thermodesulfobacteriota bacterium]
MKRIFIDTNILISAIVFDKKELELIIRCVSERYKICISEHILEEATRVFMKKFTEFIEMYEKFIGITKIEVIKKKSYDYNIKEHQNIRDK